MHLIPSIALRPISISIGSTSTASLPLRNLEDATSCLAATSGFKLDISSTVTEQYESDRTWGTITRDEAFQRDKIGLGCTGIYIILYLGSALGGFRTVSSPLDWWAFTRGPIG